MALSCQRFRIIIVNVDEIIVTKSWKHCTTSMVVYIISEAYFENYTYLSIYIRIFINFFF